METRGRALPPTPVLMDQEQQVINNLKLQVDAALFTPFLGAGASSLRPAAPTSRSEDWAEVAQRIALIESRSSEAAGRYVRTLAKDHHVNHLVEAPTEVADEDLLDLQVALAEFGAAMVEVFGNEMVKSHQCVSDVAEYELPVTEREDRRTLVDRLITVLDMAWVVRANEERPLSDLLDPHGVYRGLQSLASSLLDPEIKEISGVHARLEVHGDVIDPGEDRNLVDFLRPARRTGVTLTLEELEWTGDLLWHTLRYAVAAYPTGAELAFRICLGVELDPPPRRGQLAQTAEAHTDVERLQEVLRTSLKFSEDNAHPHPFHEAVAASLLHCYSKYVARLNGHEGRATNGAGGGAAAYKDAARRLSGQPVVPLVVTTNYDRCIENVFERRRHPYHVIFPVETARGGSGSELRWFLKTWEGGRPRFHEFSSGSEVEGRQGPPMVRLLADMDREDPSPEKKDSTERALRLLGPVVVKLHGSPLDDLPAEDELPDDMGLRHFVVLSESDYLRAMVQTDNLFPKWIDWQMGDPKRATWFLGYSVADWNVRLSLYRQVLTTLKTYISPSGLAGRIAVNRRIDWWRSAVLGTFDVKMVYMGELEEFASLLRRANDRLGVQ